MRIQDYLAARRCPAEQTTPGRIGVPFGDISVRYDPTSHRSVSKPLMYEMGRMAYYGREYFNLGVVPQPYVDTGIVAYGQDGFAYSGPMYRQTTRDGGKHRVWFDQAEGLKTRDGGPVKGFTAILPDGSHVPAQAKIDGSTVVVSAPEDARAVAYAWDYNPDANLVNAAGLPASLFRSDDRDEFVLR